MLYTERKEFLYDPALFKRGDSQTALKIYAEYVLKFSANPTPQFFEVDRQETEVDHLWNVSLSLRTQFTQRSPLSIPALNQFQKPDWRLTKLGLTPQRRDTFILSNLHLQEVNYFPVRGDFIYWNGYRLTIINAVPPPEAYWQQTGVWLGIACECIVAPEGDAKPLQDLSKAAPQEVSPYPSTPAPVRR